MKVGVYRLNEIEVARGNRGIKSSEEKENSKEMSHPMAYEDCKRMVAF
jgi:hypothetical protein